MPRKPSAVYPALDEHSAAHVGDDHQRLFLDRRADPERSRPDGLPQRLRTASCAIRAIREPSSNRRERRSCWGRYGP